MILLEKGNRILLETVSAVLLRDKEERPTPSACEVKLCDFDDVTYKVTIVPDNLKTMTVSMNCPQMHQIGDKGAKDAIEAAFPGMSVEPEVGYDVTLSINVDDIKDDDAAAALCEKLQTMKSITIGGVFDYYLTAMSKGDKKEDFSFDLRSDTTVYMCPRDDRVTIVFAIDFSEAVDKVIARVFMQEFAKSKGGSPPCNWSVDPPLEVKSFGVTSNPGILGYISFAVLKRHAEKNKADVIHVLQTFRSFTQYHIKMSKSYWHSRMRARTLTLLKVLNRAKVEDPNADNKKKTASGKTFKK